MVTIIKHILDKYFKNNLNPTLKDCKDYVESIDKNEFLKYASSSYVKQFVKEKENNNIDITLPTNKICRTKLYKNKNYEIILISWLPGAKSHIHNHSDNGCLYRLIHGTLIEEQYHTETLESCSWLAILSARRSSVWRCSWRTEIGGRHPDDGCSFCGG